MKFGYVAILLVFLSATSFAQTKGDRGYRVKVGDMAPNIVLHLTDGTTTSLQQLRGKVVVLQFTASWCSVCRREMPHLESDICKVFKNKNFVLIGVDYDEPLNKVMAFKKEMKVTYPFALDPGAKIFTQFANKGAGVTRNVVINPEGKIVFLTRLYNTTEFNAMKEKIASLLSEK
ncbi:Thioredoxin domain-containing protein BT1583 [hydrothermal vent metagenome]|uniref:Thioredoxin domain-containing protein BT1583 n=1 Tax=hydrothermal vent metagenome TaxID=652676 RepID=A0A3B0U7T4_9ZZZZ